MTSAKSFLYSKTVWTNVIGVAVTLATQYGFYVPGRPDPTTLAIVMGGLNVALRFLTKGPISLQTPAAQPAA